MHANVADSAAVASLVGIVFMGMLHGIDRLLNGAPIMGFFFMALSGMLLWAAW